MIAISYLFFFLQYIIKTNSVDQRSDSTYFMKHGFYLDCLHVSLNRLSQMPILGSSSSAANKDMMSKKLTNGDTIF